MLRKTQGTFSTSRHSHPIRFPFSFVCSRRDHHDLLVRVVGADRAARIPAVRAAVTADEVQTRDRHEVSDALRA